MFKISDKMVNCLNALFDIFFFYKKANYLAFGQQLENMYAKHSPVKKTLFDWISFYANSISINSELLDITTLKAGFNN